MRFILLFICSLFLFGCAKNWYLGEWTVTDVTFPAISAISYEEASAWFGAKASYSTSHFSFRDKACQDPQFELESLTESEFYTTYRTTFRQLNIDGDTVTILQLSCAGAAAFPGTTLIQVTADSAYTPWDGAFFKLERNTR